MNGITLPSNTNSEPNTNVIPNAESNVNLTSLNNEQVVHQEQTVLPLDNFKSTDAEPAIPYPQNG